uniref:Uncharacterized protein n=1 Tax=Meloidogyne enterolobii TaxID=390850 RepID=A0A6V7VHZ3_MELEN|nr:unnamed protein product [Meloidogyne enterolobii]
MVLNLVEQILWYHLESTSIYIHIFEFLLCLVTFNMILLNTYHLLNKI